MWDIIGMSLSHCTGGNNGVGLRHGWVCVQLLTPVIAACFDVFFNVVLCCLLMYILIIIKGSLNKPSLVIKAELFQCSYKWFIEKTNNKTLVVHVHSPWDPLKQRCHRRPTQSCETPPVSPHLKISCPLDVFGPEWRTSDATEQAHQCGNVNEICQVCDRNGRDEERGGRSFPLERHQVVLFFIW